MESQGLNPPDRRQSGRDNETMCRAWTYTFPFFLWVPLLLSAVQEWESIHFPDLIICEVFNSIELRFISDIKIKNFVFFCSAKWKLWCNQSDVYFSLTEQHQLLKKSKRYLRPLKAFCDSRIMKIMIQMKMKFNITIMINFIFIWIIILES